LEIAEEEYLINMKEFAAIEEDERIIHGSLKQ
jgi:hypothetical protein